jgi:hypothetical protein
MGLGRRIVRKTVRKATPRPVRQAMHPARTVKNAVTPRPVRQVSRAAYTIRNPVGASENKIIGAVLNAGSGRRRRRSGLGLFAILFGTGGGGGRHPARSVAPKPANRPNTVTSTASAATGREDPPRNVVRVPEPPRQAKPTRKASVKQAQPIRQVPAKPPARTAPARPFQSSGGAGDWELEVRRHGGLGSGTAEPGQANGEQPP